MLNELRDQIHQNAKDHGWWNEERSFGEIIALFHSELSEALEEYRSGHKLNETYTVCKMEDIKKIGHAGCGVCKNCSNNKPEGIPIELADVIIRILDYFGYCKWDIDRAIKFHFDIDLKYKNFGEFISVCHAYLSKALDCYSVSDYWFGGLVNLINNYCFDNRIDLEGAIIIKHECNKSRPYRHGGKTI